MALLFQRAAHNFVKSGYFPTDNETLSRILSAISPCDSGKMRIFDPCAGEGSALSACKQHLGTKNTEALGIEYHEQRAWQAKSRLDRCIHADVQQCVVSHKSFGLLFLNPPYGDFIADQTYSEFVQQGRKRLEKLFYQLTTPGLQVGGILVFIIPVYSLDKELAHWIAHRFDRVEIFTAPEQRYQQIVIFGVRCEASQLKNISQTKARLLHYVENNEQRELPDVWQSEPYQVPAVTQSEIRFFASSLDAKQLESEIRHQPCLWDQFHQHFGNTVPSVKRPLMPLSQWHLALSLAAGQVSGVVNSHDGRTFVIRGDTHKEVTVSKRYEQDADGNFSEVITHLDKFVPVIRAIDMTPQSPTFGDVLTIQ